MNDKTRYIRQGIENLKGEIEFRAKLAIQHVTGEVLLPDYYRKEEYDRFCFERADATHKRMKALGENAARDAQERFDLQRQVNDYLK